MLDGILERLVEREEPLPRSSQPASGDVVTRIDGCSTLPNTSAAGRAGRQGHGKELWPRPRYPITNRFRDNGKVARARREAVARLPRPAMRSRVILLRSVIGEEARQRRLNHVARCCASRAFILRDARLRLLRMRV